MTFSIFVLASAFLLLGVYSGAYSTVEAVVVPLNIYMAN